MTVEVIPGRGSGPDLCQGEVAGLMNMRNPFTTVSSAVSRLPLVAVLLVQAVVGYEWLNSALTKIVRGGFVSGLADQLARNSDGAPGWYRGVLGSAIIPHAAAFGYLIQAGELAVGLGLIATALVLLARGQRLSMTALQGVLAVTALMATGGAFMNLNFLAVQREPAGLVAGRGRVLGGRRHRRHPDARPGRHRRHERVAAVQPVPAV